MTTKSTGTGLMAQIMLALADAGHFVARYQVGTFYTRDGRPVRIGIVGGSDLWGFRAGDARAFFLECKDGTGRPSREQLAFIAAMKARGAIAAVVRSVEDAIRVLSDA